jgi:hypothetical protein
MNGDAGCLVFSGAVCISVSVGFLTQPPIGWLTFGGFLFFMGMVEAITSFLDRKKIIDDDPVE